MRNLAAEANSHAYTHPFCLLSSCSNRHVCVFDFIFPVPGASDCCLSPRRDANLISCASPRTSRIGCSKNFTRRNIISYADCERDERYWERGWWLAMHAVGFALQLNNCRAKLVFDDEIPRESHLETDRLYILMDFAFVTVTMSRKCNLFSYTSEIWAPRGKSQTTPQQIRCK